MRRYLLTAAIASLLAASPAHAQDEEGGDEDDTETATLLAYLGLSAADGKTEIGENATAIEAHIISTKLALEAADLIRNSIAGPLTDVPQAPGGASDSVPLLLLADKETFDLAPYYEARRQLDLIRSDTAALVEGARRAGCKPVSNAMIPSDFLDRFSLIMSEESTGAAKKEFDFQPSDFIGAFRTSSSLSAAPVTLGADLVKNALLMQNPAGGTWIVPSEIVQPSGGGALIDQLATDRALVGAYVDGKCNGLANVDDDSEKRIVAAAKTIQARADGVILSKEGAPSLLDRAIRASAIAEAGTPVRILRYEVDKAGGTVINSSNIWTSFGIPGVTIRGGLILSYRLIDPVTGRTDTAGLIVCRMPKRLLMSVTESDLAKLEGDCTALQ